MGYNISSIRIINADGFGVFPADLPELPDSWEPPPAEPDKRCPPWATDEAGFAQLIGYGVPGDVPFPWTGGNSFEALRDRVLPAFKGYAELIITWEDGDSALRCDNGKVTEHEVVLALGKEMPRA